MRKLLIIVSLIIGVISIIFIADNYFRSKYQNPFRVAQSFSYSYMIKNSEDMKSWADKRIYGKINKLQYSIPLNDSYGDFWKFFQLVSSRKLGNTMVCTYAYYDYENPPLFYSVVLKPTGSPSLWERIKDFIYFDIPLGDEFVEFPHDKHRWLVVDFFTNDDLETYIFTSSEKNPTWFKMTEKGEIDWDALEKKLEQIKMKRKQMENYENEWSDEEKIRQNAEMKKLYMDYLKGLDNNK